MTKKHFEAIAALIKERFDYTDKRAERRPARTDYTKGFDIGYNAGVGDLALRMAIYFGKENPNFDEEKFLDACGMK